MVVRNIDIDALVLKASSHASFDDGACLLEAVAYIAGEAWSDHPQCVSPVLAAFGRNWNDGMRSDDERASLKPYIPLLIGTAGDAAADERRAWMATDWLVRVATPAWLRLAGLIEHADTLAALQPITNAAYAASVQGSIVSARDSAAAAGAAAGAAARAAARAAAWAAALAAALAAAEDAAGAAAWAAAEATAWAVAGDAAWDAAGDALAPTVLALQSSAHDLFGRMIRAEECPAQWPVLVFTAAVERPLRIEDVDGEEDE